MDLQPKFNHKYTEEVFRKKFLPIKTYPQYSV